MKYFIYKIIYNLFFWHTHCQCHVWERILDVLSKDVKWSTFLVLCYLIAKIHKNLTNRLFDLFSRVFFISSSYVHSSSSSTFFHWEWPIPSRDICGQVRANRHLRNENGEKNGGEKMHLGRVWVDPMSLPQRQLARGKTRRLVKGITKGTRNKRNKTLLALGHKQS